MEVGNLDVERDFLDVRDVADAYALAVQKAETLKSGAIFNIASGIPRRVGDILELMLTQSPAKIQLMRDPKRLRLNRSPAPCWKCGSRAKVLGVGPKVPIRGHCRRHTKRLAWTRARCIV